MRNRIYLRACRAMLVRRGDRAAADARRWRRLPVPGLPAEDGGTGRRASTIDRRHPLLRRSRKQQQIAVGIPENKISRTPGLTPERLKEHHTGGLKLEEERLDLPRRRDRKRSGKQLLTVSLARVDHRPLDASQVDARAVALDLRIERRLAISECDGEAQLAGKEFARRLDIGDE